MQKAITNFVLGSILALQAQSVICAQASPQAQPQAKAQPAAAAASKDALTFYSAGVERMLVDPKDKGLVAALQLLDERLSEVPRELNKPAPGAVIQFVTELVMRPMSFRAGLIENADPAAGPPFYAQLNILFDKPETAEGRARRFASMLEQMTKMQGQPAPAVPGLKMLDMEGVPLYHGATNIDGSPAMVLAVNEVSAAGVPLGAAPLPQGVQPVAAFNFDARKIQPLIEMMLNQPGREQELAPVRTQLQAMGLMGPDAATVTAAMGYGPDRAHAAMRYTNFRKLIEAGAAYTDEPLTSADLRLIPADATYAQISKYDFKKMIDNLLTMAEQSDPNARAGLDQIEMQVGIHPQRDLLDHLGNTMGFYMSDGTGGGGIFSSVLLLEVDNPEGLSASLTKIHGLINQAAQQHAKGYVRVAEKKIGDQAMTVLTFPGLPIPLELCYTLNGNWLVAAASPQALTAALAQVRNPKSSLTENPRFKEMGGGDVNNAMQVGFLDTPRLIHNGYGLVSLGCAAISNAVRSPSDPNRDAGLILPPYSELAAGAKAMVAVTRLEGDDLICTAQFDRSLLVNASGAIGIYGGATGLVVPAMMMGITLPALGKARENAKQVKSSTQLRQVYMAVATYAAANDDALPPDMQVLIDGNFLSEDLLQSPAGSVWDGDDYWINLEAVKRLSDSHTPNLHVFGYDRAAYVQGRTVPVVFFDGHVQQVPRHEFERLIRQAPNAGTDFDLPQ